MRGILLNDRLLRVFGSSAGLRDALVLLAAAVLVIVLEIFVDLLPMIAEWARQHPSWQIDKLFTLLLVLAIGFFAFSVRRMREIGAVARRRTEAEARFRDFVAMADEWFWEMDEQLRLSMVGDKAPAPLVALAKQGAPWQPRSVGDDAWARHRAELAGRKPFRGFRFQISDDAGTVRHIQISGKPFFDRNGNFLGYRGTGSDVTAAVTAEATSAHLAHFDPLTELPNRTQLCDEVDHAAALARNRGKPAALLRVDLDRFGEINDTLGPAVGDLLLKACARRLAACIGAGDCLARISGDEFAILQHGQDQPEGAVLLCRRVLESFGDPFDLEGQEVIARGSVGVAVIGGERGDEVIKNAGIALYRAKHQGRATFCMFEPGMEDQLRLRRALEWDLKRGLEEGEFQLVYQPQIDAATRAVVGIEALVRWLHPQRGLLDAKDFITEADETGLILPLGQWVLLTACAQAVRWPGLRVAVNLSPLQFRHRDLPTLIAEALEASGLEADRLELEVPERALLPDPDIAADVLTQLRELGVRLALSSFAQGFTTLAYHREFSFDQVKIDRTFTASLARRPDAQAAAHAIEAIAHGLGQTVCAEGVENEEQETLMLTAGCALLQGRHYSAPVGPAELEALLGGVTESPAAHQPHSAPSAA